MFVSLLLTDAWASCWVSELEQISCDGPLLNVLSDLSESLKALIIVERAIWNGYERTPARLCGNRTLRLIRIRKLNSGLCFAADCVLTIASPFSHTGIEKEAESLLVRERWRVWSRIKKED
ncbi:uncharacterized [Tachysurus ichikawai]